VTGRAAAPPTRTAGIGFGVGSASGWPQEGQNRLPPRSARPQLAHAVGDR
jgi:hypothetical protein